MWCTIIQGPVQIDKDIDMDIVKVEETLISGTN